LNTTLIDEFDLSLSEFIVRVEKKFKISNQYLKYGFYYTSSMVTKVLLNLDLK